METFSIPQSCWIIEDIDRESSEFLEEFIMTFRRGDREIFLIRGERRDYFRIRTGAWTEFLRTRLQEVTSFHHMVENGLEIVSNKEHAPYARLQQLHEFYEFFQKEFEEMLERWEHRKRRASKKRG